MEKGGQRAAEHLVPRPAEEAGQGGAREGDLPVTVEREDQIGRMLQEEAEPILPFLVGGLQRLEPGGHLRDGVGQHAEIVVAADRGAHLEIAGGHAPRRRDQTLAAPSPLALAPEPEAQAEREEPEDGVRVGRFDHGGSFNSDRRTLVLRRTF
jgi:hypothetical protein